MNIDGFVLAGGRSSRMGTPKAALELAGSTYLEIAAGTLRDLGCNKPSVIGGQALRNLPSLTDHEFDPPISGPIVGLYTALNASSGAWIALLAVDLPLVNATLLKRLWELKNVDSEAIIPVQPDGRIQPLCGFYKVAPALTACREAIANDRISMHSVLDRLKTRTVGFLEYEDLPDAKDLLLNVNTPEDHARVLEILGRRS
jgi:molybdenum cofactor guanylyltransferase